MASFRKSAGNAGRPGDYTRTSVAPSPRPRSRRAASLGSIEPAGL